MTDSSIMPYGKHKGSQMADVPSGYLLFLYENNMCNGEVRFYIEENLDVIKAQIRRDQLKKER
jgi:uncharacterized protein (DUF3820 family)